MTPLAPPSPPPAPETPLVGREREQAALRDALGGALGGRGSLVLIGGEAGIGKTALAEGLLAEAERSGALVLVGRCYDLTETPPYGPWVEALERAPGDDALPPLPAALLPPERAGVALPSQDAILRHARAYLAAHKKLRPCRRYCWSGTCASARRSGVFALKRERCAWYVAVLPWPHAMVGQSTLVN